MEKYNLLYIDDSPEQGLSRYLDSEYSNNKCEINYSEIKFRPEDGYECLIRNAKVQEANIIFIDSRLFENRSAADGKFTGEEFKIILKKYYPFIEVIVITQNEAEPNVGTISKYDSSYGKTSKEYYDELLPDIIDKSIDNISIYRRLAGKLETNSSWERALIEKILNSLNGIGAYDELSKTDIDKLIFEFKQIQEKIDG